MDTGNKTLFATSGERRANNANVVGSKEILVVHHTVNTHKACFLASVYSIVL